MPGDLAGGGGRVGALDELLLGDTGPRRIGPYSEAACPEVGDVRQHRHEAHRDRAPRRLFGGVGADEPHRGLGAGVPAAHRRSGHSGPLDIVTTTPPFGGGVRRACWTKWKACRTSTFQLMLKVSQSCSSSGAITGVAPALRTTAAGLWVPSSRAGSPGSATSPVSQVSASPSSRCSSSSPPRWRATPTTCAPDSAKATAVARPKPRLAPVTTTVAPWRSTAVISSLPSGWIGCLGGTDPGRPRNPSLRVLRRMGPQHSLAAGPS